MDCPKCNNTGYISKGISDDGQYSYAHCGCMVVRVSDRLLGGLPTEQRDTSLVSLPDPYKTLVVYTTKIIEKVSCGETPKVILAAYVPSPRWFSLAVRVSAASEGVAITSTTLRDLTDAAMGNDKENWAYTRSRGAKLLVVSCVVGSTSPVYADILSELITSRWLLRGCGTILVFASSQIKNSNNDPFSAVLDTPEIKKVVVP